MDFQTRSAALQSRCDVFLNAVQIRRGNAAIAARNGRATVLFKVVIPVNAAGGPARWG